MQSKEQKKKMKKNEKNFLEKWHTVNQKERVKMKKAEKY